MAKLFAWETELPSPDLAACRALKLAPGRVAVEMAALEQTRLGFHLPDKERKNRRPALAVLLAMGELGRVVPREGIPQSEWPVLRDDLKPGDVLFVLPGDGKRIEGFGIEGYEAKNEVRLLGIACYYKGHPRRIPWDESILGVWNPMTRTARAVGKRLLLKLADKAKRTGSGLWIPDDIQSRTDVAEVLSAGAQVENFHAGDIVTFERRALHEIHAEDGVVYAFIHEDGVYARVEETLAA